MPKIAETDTKKVLRDAGCTVLFRRLFSRIAVPAAIRSNSRKKSHRLSGESRATRSVRRNCL